PRNALDPRGLDVIPCGALRGPARLAELDAVAVHAGAGRGDPVGAGLLDRDALFQQDSAGVAAVGVHPAQLVPVRVVETEGAVLVAAAGLSVNGDLLPGLRLEPHGAGVGIAGALQF